MHLSRRATGPGPRSPHHGVGHLEAAVLLQLERRDERAQEEPVHCPVGAARQAEDKPLSLELQGRGGQNPGWPQGPRQAWAPGLNGDAGQQQASLSLSFPVCEEGPRRSHLAGTGGSQEGVLTQGLCRVPSWCRLGVSMVGEAGGRAGPRSAQGWLPPPPSQPPDLVLLKTLQDRNDDGRRGLRGLSLRSPQQGKRYPQGAQRPHRCRAEGRSGHRCSRLGLTCLWPHPVPHGRPSPGGVLTPPCSWDWQQERCGRRAWVVLGRRGALADVGLQRWTPGSRREAAGRQWRAGVPTGSSGLAFRLPETSAAPLWPPSECPRPVWWPGGGQSAQAGNSLRLRGQGRGVPAAGTRCRARAASAHAAPRVCSPDRAGRGRAQRPRQLAGTLTQRGRGVGEPGLVAVGAHARSWGQGPAGEGAAPSPPLAAPGGRDQRKIRPLPSAAEHVGAGRHHS